MVDQLITESECRKLYWDKSSRPSPRTMASWRDKYELPHLKLGKNVFYWKHDIASHLRALQKPEHQ